MRRYPSCLFERDKTNMKRKLTRFAALLMSAVLAAGLSVRITAANISDADNIVLPLTDPEWGELNRVPINNGSIETTSAISSGSTTASFTDVFPNDYYAPAVAWAVEKGVTNGTSSTTFSPNADCNRAQMVTFLWRAAGSPAPESGDASKFTDVKSSDYFAQAVAWAVENGVTNGTSDAAFSPYSPVTRAQAVTFLWRAQGRPAAAAVESYADVEAGSFYADAVRWAAAKNVTKGTGESTFSPSTTVNRAMSVTFLYRAYGVT